MPLDRCQEIINQSTLVSYCILNMEGLRTTQTTKRVYWERKENVAEYFGVRLGKHAQLSLDQPQWHVKMTGSRFTRALTNHVSIKTSINITALVSNNENLGVTKLGISIGPVVKGLF